MRERLIDALGSLMVTNLELQAAIASEDEQIKALTAAVEKLKALVDGRAGR